MKIDLDRLMEQHNLDAILVTGSGQHNPAMVYLTGGAPIHAILTKKKGAEPLLFCNAMEREEAARTGLNIRSLANYPNKEFLAASGGNTILAAALRHKKILVDSGISQGRIAVYGYSEVGSTFAILSALKEVMPEVEIVGEMDDTMLDKAMFTKDTGEIERIRRVGQISSQVIDETVEFITSHRSKDGILVKPDGAPLMIEEVKNRIDLWLVQQGVENPEGVIFSSGRDTGIPHSTGSGFLKLGMPVIFDLFPCEKGGGYFHDITRTWCLGYASDAFLSLYEDVEKVYNQVCSALKAGTHCSIYQETACDLFESMGHPTIRMDPKTEQGYVHSLGHGVGLQIHERPWFSDTAGEEDLLVPGVVFTIEPGLYYPEKNLGVRLEDTFWVDPYGNVNTLIKHPFNPVLPLKK